MKETIKALSAEYKDCLIRHRRHIHANPEPSFHEKETQSYIISVLEEAGVAYMTYDDTYAVIASVRGDLPGPVLAYRADIDALRMQEENTVEDCPYRSKNDGVMHACGHDGHTAVLLTFAQLLAAHRDILPGEVIFVFQNAEEVLPGGAKKIVESGVLDRAERIYGMHLWPELDLGKVAYAPREMMSCADGFKVTFTGPGGHGSLPHLVPDVLLAGVTAIKEYQTIVSRTVPADETAVLSVCHFESGSAFNVIPDKAFLEGTVRTFNETVRETIIEGIERISKAVADAYGVGYEVDYTKGYPALVNDAETVKEACEKITARTDAVMVETRPVMVAEDFSYYTEYRKGSFFHVGCRNKDKGIDCSLHSSTYKMDEDALEVALQAFLALCL